MKFFKNKGFVRFFEKMEVKYKRTGKISGFICLESLKDYEAKDLEEIGLYFHREIGENVKISVKQLNSYFEKTNLDINSCEELLLWFNKGNIITNKEKTDKKLENEKIFIDDILANLSEGKEKEFIGMLLYEKEYRHLFKKRYNMDKLLLKKDLLYLYEALKKLPKETSVTLFSSEITKDPHYFDEKNQFFQLLFEGIKYKFQIQGDILDIHSRYEILSETGLYKEDILNNISFYGFLGKDETGNDMKILRVYYEEKDYVIYSIAQINRCKNLFSESNNIFILENPSTYHQCIEEFPNEAFICTAGNLNFSAYRFLDRLKLEENQRVYYLGDIDPEGMIIAEKLKNRYSYIEIVGMNQEIYEKNISDRELSEKSLKKLDKLYSFDENLIEAIKKYGKACYQEKFTLDCIKNMCKK